MDFLGYLYPKYTDTHLRRITRQILSIFLFWVYRWHTRFSDVDVWFDEDVKDEDFTSVTRELVELESKVMSIFPGGRKPLPSPRPGEGSREARHPARG